MSKFEKVSRFSDVDLNLPKRATKEAAGYDFEVAEDTIIPSYWKMFYLRPNISKDLTLDEIAKFTKTTEKKPTLVPTGIKCQLDAGKYLELSVRSSCPLKHWLILANGVGIIDGDYYNNSSNEGEIFFQLINLSPYNIVLKKGDRIGQGIIKSYYRTEDDCADGERLGGFGSTS